MKTCSRCKETKDETAFRRKTPTLLQAFCVPCQAAYRKEHYGQNKPAYIARAMAQKSRKKQDLQDEVSKLKDRPCADCGRSFPSCAMDFDHLDADTKAFSVARGVTNGLARRRILEEIAKCEVVCACCHRVRTHDRMQASSSGKTRPSQG